MKTFMRRGFVTLVLTVAVAGVVQGQASALDQQTYFWDCGSSRGVTLNVTVYGSQPGMYEVAGGPSGNFPPNQPQSIPMPPGQGQVSVGINGNDPGLIDKTSGVTCNASP
ncbi:hypothetical protein [Sciscionella marina]|uniref:hypothetical protein n=1 Tax=Sciscionella marina TaxID=508770 RepID=UPI00035DBE86|nr:hypothetical protein [Sciscionella marina]